MSGNAENIDTVILGDPVRDHYVIGGGRVDMTRPARPPLAAQIAAQPQDIVVDLNKTALIVIDMQNDFCSPGGWFDSLGLDLAPIHHMYPAIRQVVENARGRDVPVIWLSWGIREDRANLSAGTLFSFSKGTPMGLGEPVVNARRAGLPPHGLLQAGGWGAAVVDELGPLPGDIAVAKHRISGFIDTPLDSILRKLQVKTLMFMGVNSDECVLSTLMDANFRGYDTVMVEDCTATSSPGYCHDAAVYNVRFCFGFTVTSAGLLAGMANAGPGRRDG